MSKSRSHVSNTLRLLTLPQDVIAMLEEGSLTSGQARPLIGLGNASTIAEEIVSKNYSARKVEYLVKSKKGGRSKEYSVIPCYPDDEISIRKIITSRLASFQGLYKECITAILESSNNDRIKLNNELNKIETCFLDKKIDLKSLFKLLNSNVNEDLNDLTNAALSGNKEKTNKLLNETIIEDEKSLFFIHILNHRLNRLSHLISLGINSNIDQAFNSIKPPIFWKDKNNFIEQSKKLNKDKINKILKKTYNLELRIKSSSSFNNKILIKKLLVDVCNLSTA